MPYLHRYAHLVSVPRLASQRGFTLIELLVVILMIGILAAIVFPSFLNQKAKATDAAAKELAHTAQIAAETYALNNGGSYAGLTATWLAQLEPNVQTSVGAGNAYVSGVYGPGLVGVPTPTGYDIQVKAATGTDVYYIQRNNGVIARACTVNGVLGTGGGCINGTW